MTRKVSCDSCKSEFSIKLKKKRHGVSIEENYFKCTNCKRKYVAFVTDPECRKMQREIASLKRDVNNPDRNAINKQILLIQNKLKPRMASLKQKYN